MELDPFDKPILVSQTHDDAVFAAGTHVQAVRHRIGFDDKGVISGSRAWVGHPFENTHAVVVDVAGLSMHQALCVRDRSAKYFTDGLMTQTDPKDGRVVSERADYVARDTRVGRSPGTGRNQDSVRACLGYLLNGPFIIANDLQIIRSPGHQVDQIPGKAVVIVDDEDHAIRIGVNPGQCHQGQYATSIGGNKSNGLTDPSHPDFRLLSSFRPPSRKTSST